MTQGHFEKVYQVDLDLAVEGHGGARDVSDPENPNPEKRRDCLLLQFLSKVVNRGGDYHINVSIVDVTSCHVTMQRAEEEEEK